ncbi:hypothetical protein [Vibrio sp. CAU 1672]|uniref:hypothetical protein n=1 Tax=Vibrio sp. CAU 1672 TaxID=3032594 RepID=UPI0023DC5BF8|nr:hypothetical protein [Vibrio sp. CAU 1672]MDF2152568.1 hypothetical protein [Vibrio sp. CAU 1672]
MWKLNKLALAIMLVTSAGLSGCGSDSSDEAQAPGSPYEVKAIDGYLSNAKVWLDINQNSIHDPSTEPYTMSGSGGLAVLQVTGDIDPTQYPVIVQAIAGQTIDEDLGDTPINTPFMMSAPAGETVITPLSTMVNLVLASRVSADTTPEQLEALKQSAVQEIAGQLGVEAKNVLGDYVANQQTDALFAARSIVSSEQVLPQTPEQLSEVVENISSDPESAVILNVVEAVNEQIKQVIQETEPEQLLEQQPPVKPVSENEPDRDQDGIPDAIDQLPDDASEYLDSDGDGTGNNADDDDDGDGFSDENDHYPTDASRAGDHDGDGIDALQDEYLNDRDNDGHTDDQDAFADDPDEWQDTDKNGVGDNADPDDDGDGYEDVDDAFPTDPKEWLDTDNDLIGNNADDDDDDDGVPDKNDSYPLDGKLAGDPDNDGVDTLVDAYPDDTVKSVADRHASNSGLFAMPNAAQRSVTMLNVDIEQTIETLNNGQVITTTSTRYLTEADQLYGEMESIDIQSGEQFTRVDNYRYDFNLDGDASFIGRLLDVGSRTDGTESYWRYIDESDASGEGSHNGNTVREFDDTDFSARQHPDDLSAIDAIQHFSASISVDGEQTTEQRSFTEFSLDGFMLADTETHQKTYMAHAVVVTEDLLRTYVKEEQDWAAKGQSNVIYEVTMGEDGAYLYRVEMPVWATPTDGVTQEFADYNFTPGNWDNLTSYWDVFTEQNDANGTISRSGERFVLDGEVKLITEEAPDGLKFHDWQLTSHQVNDNEMNEFVTWQHYPLADYSFTASSEDTGQAYRVMLKHPTGIWLTYSFDEWGSKAVENLPEQIETARSAGTPIEQIDQNVVAGLQRYAAKTPHASFQYHQDGSPRQWYAVTQDPRLTNGTPSLLPITLTDNGIHEGWYVLSAATDIILAVPFDPQNTWNWFNAYYRQFLNTYALEAGDDYVSWTTDIGQLFTDKQAAEQRLEQVIAEQYRVCTSENSGERSGAENITTYEQFLGSAYNCGYTPASNALFEGLTLHFEESDGSSMSYQFDAGGVGRYYESDGFESGMNWFVNQDGILTMSNGGDPEYFAFVANKDDKFSLLGLFRWSEEENGISVPYTEVVGLEFTSSAPDNTLAACHLGDQDDGSATLTDLNNAVADCGGNIAITADMLIGRSFTVKYPDPHEDHYRLTFNDNGSVSGQDINSADTWTDSWQLENGYLKVYGGDWYQYWALLDKSDSQWSVKFLEQWENDSDPNQIGLQQFIISTLVEVQ